METEQLDHQYCALRNQLKTDLIESYRDLYSTFSSNYPIEERNVPFQKIFIRPNITRVKAERNFGGYAEVRTPVTAFRNIFYDEDKVCNNIYLRADPGCGKTAFSRYLTLAWCQSKLPITEDDQFFQQDETDTMREFDLVFLLPLRNCTDECWIENLLLEEVMPRLAHHYTEEDVLNIMQNERCLVILDGLDEWVQPYRACHAYEAPIPQIKAFGNTILTTTRPWKLSTIDIKSGQNDQILEIARSSIDMYKGKMMSYIPGFEDLQNSSEYAVKLSQALQERQIQDFDASPYHLTNIINALLWFDNKDPGIPRCEFISYIIEHFISLYNERSNISTGAEQQESGDIPSCLSQTVQCKRFYPILTNLGELAFNMFFRQPYEKNKIVFPIVEVEKILSREEMEFCVGTRLLTQMAPLNLYLNRDVRLSFAHKLLQEYFSALYIGFTGDQQTVNAVLSKCQRVNDILGLSNVFIFLCSFNVTVFTAVSQELVRVIEQDQSTKEFRNRFDENKFLKEFQDMCISCCKEIPCGDEARVFLHDVFIGADCGKEKYLHDLQNITVRNKAEIKSLHIDMDYIPVDSPRQLVDTFHVTDFENIEKLHYEGKYNDKDIAHLLKSSVKSLYLSCEFAAWSPLLSEKVSSLQNLQAISIREFTMSHGQLMLLFSYLSYRHCLRTIILQFIECAEHGEVCPDCNLDLSKHSELNDLSLHRVPVSMLNINMEVLEEYRLEQLSCPNLVLQHEEFVPENSKLKTFACSSVRASQAVETMLNTVRLCNSLKEVGLEKISIRNRPLPISSDMNIEYILLSEVTLSASVVHDLIDIVTNAAHQVTVEIRNCSEAPEADSETLKSKIRSSQCFKVLEEKPMCFKFETVCQRQ